MPCGCGGNSRSGVTLAMRHRLQWFIHLRAHSLRKGDEHPAYTPHGVWHSLPFALPSLPINPASWQHGAVVSSVRHINKVLGWVNGR